MRASYSETFVPLNKPLTDFEVIYILIFRDSVRWKICYTEKKRNGNSAKFPLIDFCSNVNHLIRPKTNYA